MTGICLGKINNTLPKTIPAFPLYSLFGRFAIPPYLSLYVLIRLVTISFREIQSSGIREAATTTAKVER